jgi:hypothetical protein
LQLCGSVDELSGESAKPLGRYGSAPLGGMPRIDCIAEFVGYEMRSRITLVLYPTPVYGVTFHPLESQL